MSGIFYFSIENLNRKEKSRLLKSMDFSKRLFSILAKSKQFNNARIPMETSSSL